MRSTSSGGWESRDAAIAVALTRAREQRLCLAAKTNSGIKLLDRRVSAGRLVCVFPHLYEEPTYWRELPIKEKVLRVIRGAALLHPDWVFCDVSAALAHGLEVSQPVPGVVHVLTTRRAHTASNAHVVRHAMDGCETCIADGVRVVDIKTCTVGCLCTLDLPHGLAVGDSYLRKLELATSDLVELVDAVRCRRDRCHALRTAHLADGRSENGGESVARGTMIELGYEVPDLQVELENPLDADHPYRVDFMWQGAEGRPAIIGELDGLVKYQDEEMLKGRSTVRALSDERVRESRLTIGGARIMRFRFADVLDRGGFARLLDAFGVPKVAHLVV